MLARKIWRRENAAKYQCPVCNYKTHNKSLYTRHLGSTYHFMLSVFAKQAPRDIKVVVASFLPYYQICLLGRLAIDSLNYDCMKYWKFTSVGLAGPPFQNDVVAIRLRRTTQSPISVRLLV